MKKWLFIFILAAHPLYTENRMHPFDALKHLESCYDAMYPAIENSSQTFTWFSGIPDPFFNAVMHLSCTHVSAHVDALLQKKPLDAPVSFWIHRQNQADHLVEILKERGFAYAMTCPIMVWTVQPTCSEPGYDLRSVSTEKDREMFYRVSR